MITPLSHIKAITVLGKKPTVGSEPLHIIANDYTSKYYVKNHRSLIPAAYLINEVLAHYLLKAWNINTPEIALVDMPAEALYKEFGNLHKKSYYSRLAFGSKEVDGAFDLTPMISIKSKVDFNKFYRPEMLARIGLFDMWTENDDRPPDLKNIMLYEREERYHFLAIDHAMIFRTGVYNTLTDNQFMPTEDNYCLQSNYFQTFKRYLKATNKNWATIEEENFYLCIQNCKKYLTLCTQYLPADWGYTKEIHKSIKGFLFNTERNKSVFNEYIRLLK